MLTTLLRRLEFALPQTSLLLFVSACLYLGNEFLLRFRWPGDGAGWPDALLVIFATAATLTSLARRLPWQNVLLAAAIIAALGTLAMLALASGTRHPAAGVWNPASDIRWTVPLIWIIAVLNARGLAQLILRARRGTRNFGWEMFGLTTLLVLVFALCLEPFVTRVEMCWAWNTPPPSLDWYGVPLWAFGVWLAATVGILFCATPVLLDKKPDSAPAEYGPLVAWIFLHTVFVAASVAHGLWLAAGVQVASGIVAAVLAVRNAGRASRLPKG